MLMRKLRHTGLAFFVTATLSLSAAAEQFVTIGTGGQSGVYYQVGGAICRLVNLTTQTHGIRCTHTTGGSVDNINGIRVGNLAIGVAQSDWQSHAYNGTAPEQFPQGAFRELRALFSVHQEPFTVVARADSGIKTVADLRGKRVNIGDPGSGQRGTMEVVMQQMGWTMSDFALLSELKSSEQSEALCDNQVDAIVFTVGHPNSSIQDATTACDAVIVAVDNDVIRKLVADNDYYVMASIPGGMYKGTESAVTTFAVGATVLSSTRVSAETIYQITKAVFDNIDRFRNMHPTFSQLEPEDMVVKNLSAPLHDGAVKYYGENGWID